jgi:protein-tyrosine phosphatase
VNPGTPMITDFHSHLVPNVDDGAETVEMGLEAVTQFIQQGVSRILTTPHLNGSTTLDPEGFEDRMAELDEGWRQIREAVGTVYPGVDFRRGNEIMVDVPVPDLSDERIRLDGGRFVLIEWPRLQVPPATAGVIKRMVEGGYVPIIAHPERYQGIDPKLHVVEEWRTAGAFLQVNHGSLLGRYGGHARETALRLLRRGWVDYFSSDVHPHPGQTLNVDDSGTFMDEIGAREQWYLLTVTNPGRVLQGDLPMMVPSIPHPNRFWGRVRERLGGA